MERAVTLQELRDERQERLNKAGDELVDCVKKNVTGQVVYKGLLDAHTHHCEFVLPHTLPDLLRLGDIQASCHESLGSYLSTLACPYDFAYELIRRKEQGKWAAVLVIKRRRRPWYRDFVDFPATRIMTTDVDPGVY